jgi:hypothetical protein
MRTALLVLSSASAVLLSTACAPSQEAGDFQFRATFDKQTRGVVLHEDGEGGHAGMFGTNCPFDTRTGQVTGDYDLPDSDEDIQDGEETLLGDVSLAAIIPGTIHVLDKTGGNYTHVPIAIDGVVEGRLLFDGVVGLTGDCGLHYVDFEGVEQHALQLDGCADFEVDPITGVGVVADPDSTVVTDGQSLVDVPVTGDLVAFDPLANAFYLAQVGGYELHAVEMDGSVRWTIDTMAPITALDDAGDAGSAAIVMALDDGRGAVGFFDGQTGERIRFAETPSPADDLAVSGNGEVIAMVRPEQSFFFELVE